MKVLSRDDVVAVLGTADDALIAEVAATGATPAELAEAHAWTMSDEALFNEGRPLPSGRVAALIDILQPPEELEDSSTE